jgi:hypothetical protein
LTKNQRNKPDIAWSRGFAAASRFTPPTIMDWANGPPPPEWRLPIDDELMHLARRQRRPVIRSDSAILAEFPALNWDGPYRAVRFFLFDFPIRRLDDAAPKKREIEAAETHLNLIRDIRESIRVYMDKMGRLEFFPALPTKPSKLDEYMKGVRVLEMAMHNIEIMAKLTRRGLRKQNRGGRPPDLWKWDFVSGLANLWRIATGDDASKDLTSPFANFVAEAWASLGDDLPEVSWANQIRRRKDISSAAELVRWVNSKRKFPLKYLHLRKT